MHAAQHKSSVQAFSGPGGDAVSTLLRLGLAAQVQGSNYNPEIV